MSHYHSVTDQPFAPLKAVHGSGSGVSHHTCTRAHVIRPRFSTRLGPSPSCMVSITTGHQQAACQTNHSWHTHRAGSSV